jgi:hypothetical protein
MKDVREQLTDLLAERILVDRGGTDGSPAGPLLLRIHNSASTCLPPGAARLRRWSRGGIESP